MRSFLSKKRGFTLTELLIVMAILGLLTSVVFDNFHRQRVYVNYNDTLTKVIGIIKTARNYASTSRAVYDTSQLPGDETYIPAYGYGIYVEHDTDRGESQIILFANTSTGNNKEYQYDDDDFIEEVLVIHRDVVFELLEGADLNPPSNTTISRGVIIFSPPLADVYIAANSPPGAIPVPPAEPTDYDTLKMTFSRGGASASVPDTIISINKTAGFPEIELP